MDVPGLAPLGTDEEAAGTPTPRDAMAAIRASAPRPRPTMPEPQGTSRWTMAGLFWATAAALAAAFLIYLIVSVA